MLIYFICRAFTLTTGVDAITGTAGNDTFNAIFSLTQGLGGSLSAADVLNGGAGVDTLNISYDTAGELSGGAVISGFETIGLRAFGNAIVTFAEQTGVTNIILSGSNTQTVGLNSLVNNELVTFAAGTSQTGTVTAAYTSGSTAASVAYNGGTQGALTITGTGLLTESISSSTDKTTIGVVTLAATETTLAVTANTNLTTGAIVGTGLKTITVTGAGNVDFSTAAIAASTTSVNASALTGNLTVHSGANTTSITGGSGADRVTIDALVYSGTAKLDGGSGTDTLVITDVDTAIVFTTAAKANITGFEVLEVSSLQARAIDYSALTGLTGLNIGTATSLTVTNLGATTAVTVLGDQTTDLALNVKGATAPGTSDTLTLTLDKAGPSTAISIVTIDGMHSDGLETLNIVSQGVTGNDVTVTTDNNAITTLVGLASSNVSSINISGISDLTLATGAINKAVAFNSSTATGNIIIDASGSNTSIMTFSGGSGNDAFTGAGGADTISGGAGNDTINGGAGKDVISGGDGNDVIFVNNAGQADVITLGAGADKVDFSANALADVLKTSAGTAAIVSITDFVAGTDKIGLFELQGGIITSVVLSAAQTITTAANLTAVYGGITAIAASADHGALQAVVVTVSGGASAGTYLYVNDLTAAVSNTDDMLINITGITGTLAATDFFFA